LIDLPEYVVWYNNKGFPKELGEQLKLIWVKTERAGRIDKNIKRYPKPH
jgi:uncharacterized protein (DUF3820 family)